MIGKLGKAAKHIHFPSSSSSHSRTQSASGRDPSEEMSTGAGQARSSEEASQLVHHPWSVNDFEPGSSEEAARLSLLSRKNFDRTRCLDLLLLSGIGILEQFEEVFQAVGWENFWNIEEEVGSIALTMEFLMTL